LQAGWNEEVFAQTDGAKLEASALVWRKNTDFIAHKE